RRPEGGRFQRRRRDGRHGRGGDEPRTGLGSRRTWRSTEVGERMTAHIYTEADAPIDPLKGKRIAVIGYGSQGHAHALNMHDSGLDVMVGLYQGSKSWAAAEQAGLEVAEVADAAKQADVIVMLV